MSKNAAGSITNINEGATITGEIKVEHDLRVEGYLKGTVEVGGTLVVTGPGKIEGEVMARSATIAGQLLGNIKALEKIVLEPKSTLLGDLTTRDLVIHEGAIFQGKCSMHTDERQ